MAPSITAASLLVTTLCLPPGAFGQSDDEPASSRLRIDPLLLVEAAAVWEIATAPDNPLWPGWDASDTPLLFYLPGVQDVLVNHPRPPADFVAYDGPHGFPGADIRLKDGFTLIDWDGQNTSREVAGVQTLVVADSLSNLKQSLRGLLHDGRPPEAVLADVDYERHLLRDPYDQMGMIAHEAFHVFQDRLAPGKGADERDVRLYPCLSVKNNVGWAYEAAALLDCLRAPDDEAARAAAVRWLAVRLDRRMQLAPEAVAYEDGNEFSEGLAMSVELALLEALEGRDPPEELWLAQGFDGFDDLSARRDALLEEVAASLRGEINVNNDPYGTSPVRGRLYHSGMAIAAMLDRLGADWKAAVFERDVSLTELVAEVTAPDPAELQAALVEVAADPEYDQLVAAKTALAEEGRADTEDMLAAILDVPTTGLLIDYSELGHPPVGLSFTAYGVRAVDDQRTIYTLVPISASLGSLADRFEQALPTPTLEDRGARQYRFALSEPLDALALGERLGRRPADEDGARWTVDDLDVELPGVRLVARRAEIEHRGDLIVVRHLRGD